MFFQHKKWINKILAGNNKDKILLLQDQILKHLNCLKFSNFYLII
jgi:hypothetical protein